MATISALDQSAAVEALTNYRLTTSDASAAGRYLHWLGQMQSATGYWKLVPSYMHSAPFRDVLFPSLPLLCRLMMSSGRVGSVAPPESSFTCTQMHAQYTGH